MTTRLDSDSDSDGDSDGDSEEKSTIESQRKKGDRVVPSSTRPSSTIVPTFVLRSLLSAVTSETVDAHYIYVGTQDGTIKQFDVATCKVLTTFIAPLPPKLSARAHEKSVISLILLPSTSRLLSQGREGVCRLWDLASASLVDTLHTGDVSFCRAHALSCFTASTTSTTLLACADSNDTSQVTLWDINTKNVANRFIPDSKRKLGMCMKVEVADWQGHIVVLALYENSDLCVWDVRTAQPLLSLNNLHSDVALCFARNRTLTRGASGGADSTLCFWNIDLSRAIGTVEARITLPHQGLNDLCLRHDERILASAGWDHRVRIFHWTKCKPLAVLKYHTQSVNRVCFQSDSNLLVSAGQDQKVALWRLY